MAIVAAGVLSLALTLGAPPARSAPADAAAGQPAAAPLLEEVVVTATRREESLSKIPVSVTAITQEGLDLRGIKDIQDIARFTPGIKVDNSGTSNIAIRGIASSGGAGTTGIYIDDTPIQMRALAFNPDEALPKSFDIERVEVLRGPQGTLFGAGSMGGTVRYITAQPSLHKTSIYSRNEISLTQDGDPSFETGIAVGGPLVEGTFGARISAWWRKDGGWIDRINPDTLALEDRRVNHDETTMFRLAGIWAPNDQWTLTPAIYYEDVRKHDVSSYWPLYSNPSKHLFVSANPTELYSPDQLYLPSLKIEADFAAFHLISSTSYYHRDDTTGYDGTLYNLGFYQTVTGIAATPFSLPLALLDGGGLHLNDPTYNPAGVPGALGYRAPATVDNRQRNFTQEIRLQSLDPNAKWIWTTGLFYSVAKQEYLEQIHDPNLGNFLQAIYTGSGNSLGAGAGPNDYILDFFGVGYDPGFPTDSYFLHTHAKDEQLAWFGEGTYRLTDRLKLTVGARYAQMKFSFDSLTGGPQLYQANISRPSSNTENAFTPKLNLTFQADANHMYYATYAKGFRPGGGNNPVPHAACQTDFDNFGIQHEPDTFKSDSVNSFEIGAKNNFNNRVKIASSIYYIRWNNIQQTVIPPICQISFIANLGEAVAKGGDIQAEIAMSESFTLDLSAGYTNGRFTKDSRLTPVEPIPVVQTGNSIVGSSSELSGQPPAAVTVSFGPEYKFSAFGKEAFVRADYQYQGESKWLPPKQAGDPATCTKYALQFDCANFTLSATNFVTLRSGVSLGPWQVAAFIDNLTDSHTLTGYNFTIDPSGGGTAPSSANAAGRTRRDFTFRPRTYGLSFTYRK